MSHHKNSHNNTDLSYPPSVASNVYRNVLRQSAAAICFTKGFDSAEADALELITHIMASYLNAICANTAMNCGIAGRTITIPTDVWLSLINMGQDVNTLPDFLRQASSGTIVLPAPKKSASSSHGAPLRIGRCRPHPPHVNEFLPPFPDPHTYIRTEISGEPDTSYEKVRELAATRKRDTEKSLIGFMLRIHPRTSLFREFELKYREEARRAISERERQREARRICRRQEKLAAKSKQQVAIPETPDQIMDDFLDSSEAEEGTVLSESDEEDNFELEETETSLVLKKLPAYCSVLDPSLETRPYLTALLSEEIQEDENPDNSSQQNGNGSNGTEEQVYDNAFLRPPRMPMKDDEEEMDYE